MAVLIFKPTEACNSNCVYCDAVKKGNTRVMSTDTLDLLMIRIDELLRARPRETLTLTWHGGEPLMLGPEYFEKAWEIQQKRCPHTGHRIIHNIQSNITLFDDRFAGPLKRLGIDQLGTSYDPLPGIRGPGRPPDSRAYNRMFLEGARRIEACGLHWGIIYTVHRKALANPLDVFHFLMNLSSWGGTNINPISFQDDAESELAITAREYTAFLGEIFKEWWPRRDTYLAVQPFDRLRKSVETREPRLACCHSGTCAFDWLCVGPDGEASHCGRSLDWGMLEYGNIANATFEELLTNEQRRPLAERQQTLPQTDCRGCRFWTLCHGGCPLDAYTVHRDMTRKWKWCYSVRGFMEEYFEPITGMRYNPNGHGM